MIKKVMLLFFPVIGISLSSCGGIIKYQEHLDDYVYEMNYHDNFNVLQLTDIHWNMNTSTIESKGYLDKLFEEVDKHVSGKIDLVEITGDQFMLANTYHVKTFLKYFEQKAEQYGFMYTPIWGNHDRHGLYNPNWLYRQFKKSPHCIYIELDDNLYGRSNFVINLVKDGSTKWQLANIDSGASFSETAVTLSRDYDYIRDEQVDWWIKEHERVGEEVPVIAYYHIPQQDNLEAWNVRNDITKVSKHKYFKLEGFGDNGNEEYASKFISEGRKHNLKAAFMGHAHNIDWTVEYQGVILGLGVKTGAELYYAHIDPSDTTPEVQEGLASVGINEKFDLIGASLVTIKDSSSFDLEHLYLNERVSGDFVRWVKW